MEVPHNAARTHSIYIANATYKATQLIPARASHTDGTWNCFEMDQSVSNVENIQQIFPDVYPATKILSNKEHEGTPQCCENPFNLYCIRHIQSDTAYSSSCISHR
jgi:hypothetical protein